MLGMMMTSVDFRGEMILILATTFMSMMVMTMHMHMQ